MTIAVGDISNSANSKRSICLMTAQTADTTTPSSVTDGVPNYPTNIYSSDTGACFTAWSAKNSTINIHSEGGSTPSAKFNLWGYQNCSGKWYLIIQLNSASAITKVVGGNDIGYSQVITNLGHYDRLFLEMNTSSGLGSGASAWLTTDRGVSV